MGKNRRISEIGRPFETQRGEILVGQAHLFCGEYNKISDAFTLERDYV